MKLPNDLKRAAKIRMDYNENHDENGRFSVSTPGSPSMFNGSDHKTQAGAEKRAKEDSAKRPNLTHAVHEDSKLVAAYRNGKEIDLKTGKIAAPAIKPAMAKVQLGPKAKANFGARIVSVGPGGKESNEKLIGNKTAAANLRPGESPRQGHERLNVAKDVKSSESPAGTAARAAEKAIPAHLGGTDNPTFVKLVQEVPGGASGPVATSLRYHMITAERHEDRALSHRAQHEPLGAKKEEELAHQSREAVRKIAELHASKQVGVAGADRSKRT